MFTQEHLLYSNLFEAKANQPVASVARIDDMYAGEQIVFFRLNGMESGPVMWLQAALHGDEYDGILACIRLLERIDPRLLKGSIILCPLVNAPAFLAKANGHPEDGVNMNRIFGHEPRGDSFSHHYGRWLCEQIIREADYFIDLHGGGNYLEVCPFAMVASNHPSAYQEALRLLEPVNLMAIYECDQQSKGMFINEVCCQGIPAVLLESGGGLNWSTEAVLQHEQSVLSILQHAGMLPRSLSDDQREHADIRVPLRVQQVVELRFDFNGLQLQRASVGAILKKGETLLEVMTYPDFMKRVIENPLEQAIVLSIHMAASLKQGDYAVMLGKIENN